MLLVGMIILLTGGAQTVKCGTDLSNTSAPSRLCTVAEIIPLSRK